MNTFFTQISSIWQKMEIPQRVTLVLITVLAIGVLAAIGYGATRPDYTLLASDLSQAETARIAAYLQDQGVPYRLVDRDTAVLVPRAERYSLLNILSEQELLTDGSNGFEILAEGGMGESTFSERHKHDRALAGELERCFREIDGVRSARVLINRPEPSPFITDTDKPTASVKLSMQNGRRLTKRQLAGVIHLVSGAIGGVPAERIKVMDDAGLLTSGEEDPGALAASTSLEAEQAMERHLTSKAQQLLDRVLGPGRSLVSLSVDLDFTTRTQASSTPTDPVIVQSTTRETDSSTPVPAAAGVAGTAANIENPAARLAAEPRMATETSSEETLLYATGKKTVTENTEVGLIRGMSVSILLDHEKTTQAAPNAEGAEIEKTVWRPYSAEDQQRFKNLVIDAIGFEAAKGTQLALDPKGNAASRFTATVQSLRMNEAAPLPAAEPVVAGFELSQLEEYLRYAVAGLVGLALLWIARGQLKKSRQAWQDEQRRREQAAAAEQERQKAHENIVVSKQEEERRMTLRQEIQKQIRDDPDAAASVLRTWIHSA